MNPRSVFCPERNSSGDVPEGTVHGAAAWAGQVATVTIASNNPTVILPTLESTEQNAFERCRFRVASSVLGLQSRYFL